MKRIVSLLFAVALLALCVISASAEPTSTDPSYIYFEVPSEGGVAWNSFNMVYCHMWSKTAGDVYGWQDKHERCEDMGNGYWRYDLSGIEFKSDQEYSLIFSNDAGLQTYNLNITSSCKGDIAYCKGDTCVNPVDGAKTCAVARWRNSGDKVHPAIEMDSNGVLLNPDEADAKEIETAWGTGEGSSYELPERITADKETEVSSESATVDVEKVADKEDGINLTAATTWIIIVAAVLVIAIVTVTVLLAKRNKNN